MSLRFLHTAHWHIGQLFHEYDRNYEHQQVLNWLVQILEIKQIEVLLISGEIFDIFNQSAQSIRMFYTFLNQATTANPNIQIIIIAGNHDSASRLEAPKPLLQSSNVHIIGLVEKDVAGNIDYEKLIVPIHDACGWATIRSWQTALTPTPKASPHYTTKHSTMPSRKNKTNKPSSPLMPLGGCVITTIK